MIQKLTFVIVVIFMAMGLLIGQLINEPGPKPIIVAAIAQNPDSIRLELQRQTRQLEFDRDTRVARFLYRTHGCSGTDYSELTARNAIDRGLPVRLVAAVVIYESTCRPYVVSGEGAVGLMQISKIWRVPKWKLKDPAFNLAKGTEILINYVRHYGIREGLHHYNGLGIGCSACDAEYADKVLSIAGIRG